MLFSIIVPTCDRNESLANCLNKLDPHIQNLSSNSYEVIVTDDSLDNCAKELICENYNWVKWVPGPKKGPAANRNNGAKYASAEWLVFIDDDCIPDAEILFQYEKGITDEPECLAFEGAIIPDSWKLLKKDLSECPINTKGGCFWSANVCIKASIFKEVKGFDEDFAIAAQEDQFLYYKLKMRTNIKFLTLALIIHPVRLPNLLTKIRGNYTAIDNWYLYQKKLGFSLKTILTTGLKSQLLGFINNIKKVHLKSSILNFHVIFVGLPYLIIKHGTKIKFPKF